MSMLAIVALSKETFVLFDVSGNTNLCASNICGDNFAVAN
jgi:hypothetical protein